MRRFALAVPVALVAVSAALASEGAEVGEGQLLITPKFGTIIWTLLTFGLLLILLRAFAWKPILGALEAREGQIRGDLDRARHDREEAQKVLAENKEILQQARRERAEAVESGRRDAERLKEEILEEARGQREQLLAQAKEQIQAEVRAASAELRKTAADLAVSAAGKLLEKNLDDAAQRRIVEEYLDDLDRLPPGSASLPG